MDPTAKRKIDHLNIIARDPEVDRAKNYFDDIRLRHRALPEVDLQGVDPSLQLFGKRLDFPLLISSMTGGDNEDVRRVNRNLAIAAEATGVAMGVGSQRVMFTHPPSRDSFALRLAAPNALLFANLGAIQLNCGFGVEECREAIEVLDADGIFLHLNPLQEAVQPEGDTNFGGLTARIGEVAAELKEPVIAKEIGTGISRTDAEGLLAAGIRYVDVAGAGGTSWSRIEHHRAKHNIGLLFQDWGLPTPVALAELRDLPELRVFASGGIRNGLDMAKAVILGASLCGMASPFLKPARRSADAVIAVIENLRREFTTAMFLLGAANFASLRGNDSLLL
jgi:isopentenyl-diphosphate delta-isomerase